MRLSDKYSGKVYWLTDHAMNRADEKGISEEDILQILRTDKNPYYSEVHKSWVHIGKVEGDKSNLAVCVIFDQYPPIITTVYWERE